MADKITNDITLLFKTQLDEKSKQEVGKNLKGLLENAVIGFDEAEIKKNLQPIIRMMKMMFDKAEMKFDADKLLGMPSRQALQEVASMTAEQFQMAFDRALAKSGGVKIDFGNVDLSGVTEPLERVAEELSEISRKIANDTKKSVDEIDLAIKRLDKVKPKKINAKVAVDGVASEISALDSTLDDIELVLSGRRVGIKSAKKGTIIPEQYKSEDKAIKALTAVRNAYIESVEGEDPWEKQYMYLLQFVKNYEAVGEKIRKSTEWQKHPEFSQLYDILSPKAGAAKISLEHFVDIARGNELSEYKNQPWARESTLKKVEQALRNGIIVKDGGDGGRDDDQHKEPSKPISSDSGDGDNNKKLNTKVPVNDAESEAAKVAKNGSAIDTEKLANEIVEVVVEPVLTDLEKKIIEAVEEAKSKTTRKWENVKYTDRDAWVGDAIKSRFAFSNNNDRDNAIAEAVTFSDGDADIHEVSTLFEETMISLDETYDKVSDEMKRLLERYSKFADTSYSGAKKVFQEIYSADAEIGELVNYVKNEYPNLWDSFRQALRSKVEADERNEDPGIDRAMQSYQDEFTKRGGKRETLMYINSQTGEVDEMYEGEKHEIKLPKGTRKEKSKKYDMEVHSHSYKTAAPSVEDLEDWLSGLKDMTKFAIRAGEELLSFDFSGFTDKDADAFLQKYKDLDKGVSDQFKAMSFDEKAALSLEHGSIEEATQAFLRRGLEDIVNKSFPNIMKSIKMPDLPVDRDAHATQTTSFLEAYAGATDEIKAIYKELAILEKQLKKPDITDDETDALYNYQDELYEQLPGNVPRGSEWNEYVEYINAVSDAAGIIDVVTTDVQEEATAHQENTAAIVAETQSIKELNEEKSKSLLPTADGLEAHTYAPSDDQKEYVLKLGEEYRTIMEILERGDSELESALVERAKAIRNIMFNTVRGSDGFLGHEYENIYGGSHKTATSLEDWRQSDRFLSDPDSDKIDDSQRQAAIDLIYKELEAEKQLEVERIKAREAAKQREVDAFNDKYSSASEEEKKILYEIIELEKEHRTLSDIGDEESHKLALETLEKVREKYNALEKLNGDLLDAYDDVGFKRAEPYIDAPPATPKVDETPVDTSAEQAQLTNLKGSVDDVTGAVNAKTEAFKTEGIEVGKVVDGEIEKLGALEDKISATKSALAGLINNIETDADNVGTGLGNITVNVNHKKEEDAEQTVSINQDSLKNTLENIVYNVKLTHDNTDKESNKIAIDEGTLKSVLEKITYNVSVVRDDDNLDNKVVVGDNKDAPDQSTGDNKEVRSQWQNDISTLLTRIKVHTHNTVRQLRDNVVPKILEAKAQDTDAGLKSILEQIRNNTAKIGTVPQTPANDSDSILSQISKNVLEINGKIVKGTKAPSKDTTKTPKIPAGRDAQILAERKATQRLSLDKFKAELETSGKMTEDVAKKIRGLAISLGMVKDSKGLTRWGEKFKQEKLRVGIDTVEQKDAVAEEKRIEAEKIALRKQYQELGVLEARAEEKKTEEANARLEQLRQEIASKQESLNISEEELRVLQQLREDSKADELDILDSKRVDKDIKKQAANAKKMAQREAMLGKAGNAVGRAENTWMNAVGIEGELPADFVAEIDNYYQKLDAVRKMHQELKNSDMISEEQKKELIAQTMSINKMTDEIGELVSEYQKLSGDNATVIGTNTLDSGAGLNAYEQQLKQTVMAATNGKAQIKNFDAATKTLTYTVKTGKNEFTEYTAAVRRADGALVSVQGATKRTETFIEATKRKMKELTSYFSGMAIFNRVGQELRRGVQYVREIDLALTELKKVTDETEETYDRFLNTAAKTADKVGSTIQKVVSSTADWARLGSILAGTNIRPII